MWIRIHTPSYIPVVIPLHCRYSCLFSAHPESWTGFISIQPALQGADAGGKRLANPFASPAAKFKSWMCRFLPISEAPLSQVDFPGWELNVCCLAEVFLKSKMSNVHVITEIGECTNKLSSYFLWELLGLVVPCWKQLSQTPGKDRNRAYFISILL